MMLNYGTWRVGTSEVIEHRGGGKVEKNKVDKCFVLPYATTRVGTRGQIRLLSCYRIKNLILVWYCQVRHRLFVLYYLPLSS